MASQRFSISFADVNFFTPYTSSLSHHVPSVTSSINIFLRTTDQDRVANSLVFSIGRSAAVKHPVDLPDPTVFPCDSQRNDFAVLRSLAIHLNKNLFQLAALPALFTSNSFDAPSITNICSRFKDVITNKKDLPRYLGKSYHEH